MGGQHLDKRFERFEPKTGPMGSQYKIWKKTERPALLGFCCHFRIIVIANLLKIYAQKLRSVILLPFELITFRFVDGRTLKQLISVISGFSHESLSPKTNYLYLWRL